MASPSRRAAAPVVASIDEENGRYRLHVCCDGRAPASGTARLFLQPFDRAEPLAELRTDFAVEMSWSWARFRRWSVKYSTKLH